MWGGLHYGFSAGGLAQAIEDKYDVTLLTELPGEPAPNQRFLGVDVLIPHTPDITTGCVVDAGDGIETLRVFCPREWGGYGELAQNTYQRPSEWFGW